MQTPEGLENTPLSNKISDRDSSTGLFLLHTSATASVLTCTTVVDNWDTSIQGLLYIFAKFFRNYIYTRVYI